MRLLIFATLCLFLFTFAAADEPATVSFPYLHPLPTEITVNSSILWSNSHLNLDTYTAPCEGGVDCLFRPILFLRLLGYSDSRNIPFMSCGFLCRSQGEYECYHNSALFAVILHYSPDGGSYDMGMPQVLWSANRDHPVKDNATLEFSQDGNLILRDVDDTIVWTTNSSGRSVMGMKLTETGSLVLVDGKDAVVWTSHDHPTDTWFVGQTLREGQCLTANASATSSSQGQFYLSVVRGGLAAYIDSDPPQLYYQLRHSSHNALNKSTYVTNNFIVNKGSPVFGSYCFSFSFSNDCTIYSFPLSSRVTFHRLESDGHLRHYRWATNGWYVVGDVFALGNAFIASRDRVLSAPLDYCSYPMVCGEYGVCSKDECNCLDHTNFNLINESQSNPGCSPVATLSCSSTKNHQLIRFDHISYFNYNDMDAAILQGTNEEHCKEACLRNCSCKAALFHYAIDNLNGSCYLPSQLYSLMNSNPKISGYNSVAHIKIQIDRKEASATTIVVVIFGAAFSTSLATGFIILRRRRRRGNALRMEKEDNFELIAGLRKMYSFDELNIATQNFCQKIGQGGSGSVFLGTLNGEKVAVKFLDGVGQGMKEFLAEVNTIGNIHHINLVRLVGFCWEKSRMLLVYEYMCNGSLDKWLFWKNKDVVLHWQTRFQIITDVARGLSYLHGDCRQRIAHFDIKPQNILLDADFHAKVADFGLSKLIDREQSHVLTRMRGTRGYLAPEWLSLKVTEKVDVYSFGVVIMEIICGRKNLDYSQPEESFHLIAMLEKKVQTNQLLDLIESNNHDILLPESKVIEMMKLAMWCLQINSARRPSMSMVVQVLEGSINVETDIDYNFTSVTMQNVDRAASTLQSASLLSGPR